MSFKSKISNSFILVFLIVTAIVIVFFCIGKPESVINPSTKIIFVDSSITNSNLTFAHNSLIITLLQQREATEAQLDTSSDEEYRQLRNIYIAIIAVLLPMIIIVGSKRDQKDRYDIANIARWIILVLIPLLLYINSDIEERKARSNDTKNITHFALEELINNKKISTLWFKIDYKSRNDQLENVHHPFIRKLRRAARPSIETIIFYWCTWMLVLYFHCSVKRYNNTG